jgi:hypoxanthine phosphoribosyltransferase
MNRNHIIEDKSFRLLVSGKDVAARVATMAECIEQDFAGQQVHFVGIMNGSFMFAADLLRRIHLPVKVSFIRLASYEGRESTGLIRELCPFGEDLTGQNIVLLEDIVETGTTIEYALKRLRSCNPAKLAVATLLFKPRCLVSNVSLDYVGFELEDRFVVGYGLDYNGYGRNWDGLYAMD